MGASIGAFIASDAGEAILGGAATAAVGVGASSLLAGGKPNISIPPPPGATMVDQAGSTAAADSRPPEAIAGGLQSTVGAGGVPQAPAVGGATSGSKALLGS